MTARLKTAIPRIGATRLNAEQRDLIRRRTAPFVIYGTEKPLQVLLAECYLQGCRDTLEMQVSA